MAGWTVRRATIRVHKWVGLIVALWIVVQTITGVLLVFGDQLDAWSRPNLYHHTAGDIGAQRASDAALSAIPSAKLASVQTPANETGVYVVAVRLRPAAQRLVFVDPGTGHVNGVRDPNAGFVHWIRRLHVSLLQTRALGVKGSTIVGWLGVVSILVVLSGAYLWLWPALRKASTLFRFRRKSPLVFALDVHRLVGIVVFPLLLITLLTGVDGVFGKELRPLWYAVTPGADKGARTAITAPHSLPHAAEAMRASLDAVRETAAAATGGRVDSINLPSTAAGSYAVSISRGWDPARGPRGRGGNLIAYVDQYQASMLRVSRPSDLPLAGQLYEYWVVPTHGGSLGGIGTRWLLDLTGLGALGMIGSGITLTLVRRRKRIRRVSALQAALPKLPAVVVDEAAQQSWIEEVRAGTVVLRQGDAADAFYIVLDGEFDVLEDDVYRRTLGPGATFGQIGLLVTGVRTATVTARSDAEIVVVPVDEFEIVLRRAERDGLDLTQAGLDYAANDLGRSPSR